LTLAWPWKKAWAEWAGLGWIGKHGLVVSRSTAHGSPLSVMVIDRSLDRYHQPHPRLCGDCDLCLRACPTGGIPRAGVVDARLCLSFQTVENHESIPVALRAAWPGVHSAATPARKSAPTITLGCLRAILGKLRAPSGSCQRRRLQILGPDDFASPGSRYPHGPCGLPWPAPQRRPWP